MSQVQLRSYPSLKVLGALLLLGVSECSAGCSPHSGRSAVPMWLSRSHGSPRDASVYIDEEYIGPLGFVAQRGVRLPLGQHRLSVLKSGYFPWDRLLNADRQPLRLRVKLRRIPD